MSTRIGETAFALLAADAAVCAQLGAEPLRLFPNRIPANLVGLTYPAATYSVVSDTGIASLDGWTSGLRSARFQVDCYSPSYGDAQAAADAVEDVLKAYTSPAFKSRRLLRRDLWDRDGGSSGLHRVSIDFQCGVAEV